jgi:hypothetical protein
MAADPSIKPTNKALIIDLFFCNISEIANRPRAAGKKSAVPLDEKTHIKGFKKININSFNVSSLFRNVQKFITPKYRKIIPIIDSKRTTMSILTLGIKVETSEAKIGRPIVFA